MTYIEYMAAACGIFGTLLLALNGKRAGWGFVAFLASNAGWITFAAMNGHMGLLVQHAIFSLTSAIGIFMWLVRPQLAAAGATAAQVLLVMAEGEPKLRHAWFTSGKAYAAPYLRESTCELLPAGRIVGPPYVIAWRPVTPAMQKHFDSASPRPLSSNA